MYKKYYSIIIFFFILVLTVFVYWAGLQGNFLFDDDKNDVVWSLIENKTTILTSKNKASQLFDNVEITVFLLPEFKKADYLLKIENIDHDFDEDEMIEKMLSIKNITTVYTIDTTNLKSKNNLIF